MTTGTGSGTLSQVCSDQKMLEISPSANAASSPVYGGGGGKKKSSGKKMEKPKKD